MLSPSCITPSSLVPENSYRVVSRKVLTSRLYGSLIDVLRELTLTPRVSAVRRNPPSSRDEMTTVTSSSRLGKGSVDTITVFSPVVTSSEYGTFQKSAYSLRSARLSARSDARTILGRTTVSMIHFFTPSLSRKIGPTICHQSLTGEI